jgi:hypothetical protein
VPGLLSRNKKKKKEKKNMFRRLVVAALAASLLTVPALAKPGDKAKHAPKPLSKITGTVASYLGDDAKVPGSVGFTKLLVSDDGKGTYLAAIATPKGEQDSIFEDYQGDTLITVYGRPTGTKITVNGQTVPVLQLTSVEAVEAKTGKTVYVVAGYKGGNDETGDFWEDFTVANNAAGTGSTVTVRDRDGQLELGKKAKHPVGNEIFPDKKPTVGATGVVNHP